MGLAITSRITREGKSELVQTGFFVPFLARFIVAGTSLFVLDPFAGTPFRSHETYSQAEIC